MAPDPAERVEGAEFRPESVRSRYVVTLSAQVFRLMLSLISATIVPRALGPAVYGNYSFLLSTSTTLRGVLDTGTQQAFFTFSSQEGASGSLTRLYALVLCIQFSIVVAIIALAGATGRTDWLWHAQRLDQIVLVTALSSGELLDELKSFEPLAPAFIRGIEAQRRLLEEYGGILTAQQAGEILGISRQSVDKRRRAHTLLPLTTGRHGYRYPAWQFTKSGAVLSGVEDVLQALGPHDEWMQAAFFASENPRLANRTPIEMLKAGELKQVIGAAQAYGEHGAA